MERKKPESVGDVLRSLLDETSLQGRIDELKAAEIWNSVVGPDIAALCKKPSVKNGVMTVGVSNASLRNDLMLSRSQIISVINGIIGKDTIKEIKFIS